MHAQNASKFFSTRLLVSLAIIGAISTGQAFAQTKGKPTAKGRPAGPVVAPEPVVPTKPTKDERVDISDIESKYWAPKDQDFSVVQNRTYTKEKKFAFSLQYGPIINETFSEGNSTALGVNYFFNERMGVQLDYVINDYSNTDLVSEVIGAGGSPNYGRSTGYFGIGYNYVPFYAKMSFLGSKIIYFDMAITPTIGMTEYDQLTLDLGNKSKSSLSYGFDITQWFFIYERFAIRVDIKNRWFKEEVVLFHGPGGVGTGSKVKDKNTDNTLFLIGGTFFF